MQQQTAASPMRTWRLINVAWKKILGAPANLGSQAVAWPPVATRMEASYERAKRSHEAHLPRLRGLSKTSRSREFRSHRLRRWDSKAWTRCSRTLTRWSLDILHGHDPSRLAAPILSRTTRSSAGA